MLNIKFEVMEMKYSEETKENFLVWITPSGVENFFKDHRTEINYTVMGYNFLKETYENNGSFCEDNVFQSFFRMFYYMRYIEKGYADDIFEKVNAAVNGCKSLSSIRLDELTKNVCNGKSIQFSFITKLLNLKNDELFPIYDSKVALVFHFKEITGKYDEKIHELCKRYDIIRRTYEELIKEERTREFLTRFRQYFKSASCLSDMRIIDIIFWQKGKYVVENTQNL